MRFLKENSYDIVKLYINQIGITIFSLVLYTAANFFEDEALKLQLKIVLSVAATVFYLALVYAAAWDFGARDRIKIDSGKLKAMELKGALMSSVANSLNFVFAAACVIIALATQDPTASGAFAVFNLIMRFTMAMFIGIIQGIFTSLTDGNAKWLLESIGYLVAPLLSIGVTQLGYSLGMRNRRILSVFSGSKSDGKGQGK